jgi:hypothetical protein
MTIRSSSLVKPLLFLQMLLQLLDLHSTLSHLADRTEINKAIIWVATMTGMAPAVILMKVLSVAVIWLLYVQWQKIPKPSVFDRPIAGVFIVLNVTLLAIVFNNYWG